MNISYNWLKELIEIELSPVDLAERLTLIGLELDGMHETQDDHIFDIEVTSNRGDCLSHLGVAREISAFSGKSVKSPESIGADSASEIDNQDVVRIEAPEVCQRFTARLIKNVAIGPSPDWLVKRLESIGERSINNVADVTNYVMHELGQPMHAFDLKKLSGESLVVRRAQSGEAIVTLDEVERKLDPSMLVICDIEKPVAVGGVMGGFDSGITEETTDVLLEVAYFDRDSIRQTSRDLNLASEASYHFERGVDINNLVLASNRATHLICELSGGTAGNFLDVYPKKFEPREIAATNIEGEVQRLSGLAVDKTECSRILKRLGVGQPSENKFVSPSWRHDLAIEEDLVEEVVRITGYDKIEERLPPFGGAGEYQPQEIRKRRLRRALANSGFEEALSYSFIDEKNDEIFEFIGETSDRTPEDLFVSIKDPIIDGSTRMRPSLLSGLLDATKTNFSHQNKDVQLYEIGKVFLKSSDQSSLPNERELMGIVMTGSVNTADNRVAERVVDFFDLKGAVESAVNLIDVPSLTYVAEDGKHTQKGQASKILLDDKLVGFMGRLNNEVAAKYKFKQPVFVAELDLQELLESEKVDSEYRPLPIFPSVFRDISMIVKRDTDYADIKRAITTLENDLCRKVSFVDVFEGKGMAADERSITIRLEYRSDDRTLTENEVEKVHEVVLESLKVNIGIKQR